MKQTVLILMIMSCLCCAQTRHIIVQGQRVVYNDCDHLDSIVYDNHSILFNCKGFWGPFVLKDDAGYSKQYWYNKDYPDKTIPASTLYFYSGEQLEEEDFARYNINPDDIMVLQREGKSVLSFIAHYDSLYFRSDYFFNRHVVVSYSYVRASDLLLFENYMNEVLIIHDK